MQLWRNKKLYNTVVSMPVRTMGGGHGHSWKKKEFVSKEHQVKYEIPMEEGDLKEQFTEKSSFENRLVARLSSYFRLHRMEVDN